MRLLRAPDNRPTTQRARDTEGPRAIAILSSDGRRARIPHQTRLP